MVKQVLNKAYTLVEVLLIILIMSIFIFTFQHNDYIYVLKIKSLIEYYQVQSLVENKKVKISVEGNILIANGNYHNLKLWCSNQYFHFNEDGNVSNALTLSCDKYDLVIQLGSGVIEIC